jgi:hypothetical protein
METPPSEAVSATVATELNCAAFNKTLADVRAAGTVTDAGGRAGDDAIRWRRRTSPCTATFTTCARDGSRR